MNLLTLVAYHSPVLASKIGTIISKEDEWDFIKNGGGDGGPLSGLNEKVQQLGYSGYTVLRTIGIICLILCLLTVFLCFMIGKSAPDKKENKNWLVYICIGGAGIFGVFSIVSIIASVGHGL